MATPAGDEAVSGETLPRSCSRRDRSAGAAHRRGRPGGRRGLSQNATRQGIAYTGGNTVRVGLRSDGSNPLIANRKKRVTTCCSLVAIRDGFSRHARATITCEESYPVAAWRRSSQPLRALHYRCVGCRTQTAPAVGTANPCGMSDGGIFAGERGGSEPPRRLSAGGDDTTHGRSVERSGGRSDAGSEGSIVTSLAASAGDRAAGSARRHRRSHRRAARLRGRSPRIVVRGKLHAERSEAASGTVSMSIMAFVETIALANGDARACEREPDRERGAKRARGRRCRRITERAKINGPRRHRPLRGCDAARDALDRITGMRAACAFDEVLGDAAARSRPWAGG